APDGDLDLCDLVDRRGRRLEDPVDRDDPRAVRIHHPLQLRLRSRPHDARRQPHARRAQDRGGGARHRHARGRADRLPARADAPLGARPAPRRRAASHLPRRAERRPGCSMLPHRLRLATRGGTRRRGGGPVSFMDLRGWIARLEKEGELRRITAQVDWDRELGAITRRVLETKGPALLFENITGYTQGRCTKLFTSGLGSRARLARALGFPPDTSNAALDVRSEEHTSELQSLAYLVCRLLLEKKNVGLHSMP